MEMFEQFFSSQHGYKKAYLLSALRDKWDAAPHIQFGS